MSQLVRPTVDHLLSLRLPSGNFPSSLESVLSDRLVHWCHGAPGFAHMLCLAYKVQRADGLTGLMGMVCCLTYCV